MAAAAEGLTNAGVTAAHEVRIGAIAIVSAARSSPTFTPFRFSNLVSGFYHAVRAYPYSFEKKAGLAQSADRSGGAKSAFPLTFLGQISMIQGKQVVAEIAMAGGGS